jgi:prolyl oligopeptidase
VIEWSKFCRAAWRADGSGFYYCSMQPTAAGAEYLESNTPGQIFLHRLGKPQADDELVFSADEPDWMPYAEVSDDGRFLIITVVKASVFENQLLVLDLHDPAGTWSALVGDFESSNQVVSTTGRTFYLVTDYGAERKRLVAVDLVQPGRENWREIIGETPDTLVNACFFGGYFVCHYLTDAHSVLRVHAIDGGHVRDIPLPGFASLDLDSQLNWALTGRAQFDLMHFATTTFTDPGSIWSHRLSTGETKIVERAAAAIDPDSYLTEQVFAESADGTKVPMFLTRHKDLAADGRAPALLYAYGGFDIPITPSFSPEMAVWLERGGVLAVANLRGGGEFGRAWHEAGRRAAKQNVFDDFCGCARWLASSGWSSRDRIAIMGGSNGGLLVGACLTQHPELFGAVVGHVGVYDMLRFHKFTIGWAWTGEIGSPDDPLEYQWLRAYSPLHNVQPGTRYPATLLLTGDHDDRVVPGHSFKFASALQAAQASEEPILIRVETAAGHGAGKPTAMKIEADTDVLTFLAAVLPATQG